MNGKLSAAMIYVMQQAAIAPVNEFGNKAQIKALVKRGMLRQERNGWVLTDLAIAMLHENKNVIAARHARHKLQNGRQVRHNVWQVELGFANRGPFRLVRSYYQRDFEDEVEAVHEYQMNAIELARAEIRIGLA